MMKYRRIKWAEHVARMWERRSLCRVLVGKPEREIYHLENLGAERGVLSWFLNRKRAETGLIWHTIGTSGSPL
jgi:hypothetical protein